MQVADQNNPNFYQVEQIYVFIYFLIRLINTNKLVV